DALAPIHARMPVILAREDFTTWLDVSDETDTAAVSALLRPAAAEITTAWPVSTRVNNVRNDDASLVEPIEPETGGAAVATPPRAGQGDLFSN
ncbi:MAG: SOS response-associated peptidase, partial [Alphaproteobacteria bacterium]|nr:SOS response-associated peptidase [Alphaproteobacteria bacterium]